MVDPPTTPSQTQPITITYMHPDKWEYKAVFLYDVTNTEEINQLGLDGWELVTLMPVMGSAVPVAYLKRPIYPKATVSNG